MALLTPPKQEKQELAKKQITLDKELWNELKTYAKTIGLKGSLEDKHNFIIKGALEKLFAADEYIQAKEEMEKVEAEKKAQREKRKAEHKAQKEQEEPEKEQEQPQQQAEPTTEGV